MNKKIKWPETLKNVEELHPDSRNYRIRKKFWEDFKTDDDVRNHLLEKQSVLEIARSIVNQGYYQTEILIVCEENDKLIVLDGNRRLTACQLLLKPELIWNINLRKQFQKLRKKIKTVDFQEVKIIIAPSREAAQKEVGKNHIKTSKKNWDTFQQAQVFKVAINSGKLFEELSITYQLTVFKIKKKLTVLLFHDLISEKLKEEEEKEELWSSASNLIERSIVSNEGIEFLNYKFENIKIVPKNNDEFNKKIDCLIPYFVGEKKMSAQITKKDTKKIFKKIENSLIKNNEFKNEKKKSISIQINNNISKNKAVPKSTNRKYLIPKDCVLTITEPKINNIYHELQSALILDESKNCAPNAAGVLFRVFLEISLNHYAKINDQDLTKIRTIRDKILWVIKDLIEKGQPEIEFKNIKKVASADENSHLSINHFHECVHSIKIQPSPNDLKVKWDNLQSFFKILWNQIEDEKKEK